MQHADINIPKSSMSTWDLGIDTTLIRLLARNAALLGDRVAIHEKRLGIWQKTTWPQMLDTTLACAAGLETLGFSTHDALLVLGDNRPRLYMGMLAAGMLGGYAMPVYPDATHDEIHHFTHEEGVRFVLAEDQEQVDKVLELRKLGSTEISIIYDDPRGLAGYTNPGMISWERLQSIGEERLRTDPGLRDVLIERAQPNGPGVFVHSSGTTGKPKGVVLSHRNLLAGVRNAYRAGAFTFDENILAYLPMAWMGDFAMTISAGIALHFTINIPERQETVLQDLRAVAPTFYIAAPRSWDNMLTNIQVRMEGSTPLKKWLYNVFMNAALTAERAKLEGKLPSLKARLMRPIGELLVFGPIKDQLGLTRLRNAFTGGEAIGEDTFVFYRALGVKLRQLYGQTETSAFTALQDTQEVRLHTVGKAMPGVDVKIADNGEVMIRSESVFSGYHKRETATREAFEDGWLRTGDAGYVETDGHIVVLGRLSEVVYTSKGERYIPNYIENRLKFSPYIKDVAVLGSGRDTLSAIICIDKEAVGHWAETRGIAYISYADLSQKSEVMGLIATSVKRVNSILPDGLKLHRVVSLHKEFDADDGEVTRTRKVRRNVVEERYAPIIEAIYGGLQTVTMQARITYESGEIGTIERQLSVKTI